MYDRKRLRELLVARCLLPGPVVLSNGKRSDYYFDCRRATLSAEGADLIANAFLEAMARLLPHTPAAIGGLTHGADPILGAVMMRALERGQRIDSFYVRKEPKAHGTRQWIENPPAPGSEVVILDDVVTSGASILKAIERAREHGCKVEAAMALVDRLEGGGEAIAAACPRYEAIFRLSDFPELAAH